MARPSLLLAAALLLGGAACRAAAPSLPANVLTPEEERAGWRSLFDGESLEHWRCFRAKSVSAGWRVVDGAIARVGAAGDLLTREQFADFILEIDWKISPGGNSGILFRVTEDYEEVWETGPEMQILDDRAVPAGLDPKTAAGANYALHAPAAEYSKPAGEWNHARLEVRGAHVVHHLNGHLLLEYDLWSPKWRELVAASKFAAMPDYGRRRTGHIALQDHGDEVWFRNLKILPLAESR
ncbi:MAG: DUF1080 domain-containing protein [Planctomycetota bacterium]